MSEMSSVFFGVFLVITYLSLPISLLLEGKISTEIATTGVKSILNPRAGTRARWSSTYTCHEEAELFNWTHNRHRNTGESRCDVQVLSCCCAPAAPRHIRCTPSLCRCRVRRGPRAEGGHQRSRCIPPGPRNSPCSSTKLGRKQRSLFYNIYCFMFSNQLCDPFNVKHPAVFN